jgi:RHS repeat-associated protein
MIKKILLCLLVFVCAHSAATAQFTSMNITGATTSYEGFESPIKTRYTINLTGTIPPKYYFDVQVQGGTLTAYDLTPVNTRPDAGGGGIRPMYVQVRWDCGVTNGTITVTETKSGLTTSINVYIKSFFNIPPSDYCSQTVTPKQNLHLGDVPSLLSVTYCSQTCLDNLNATYQWQVGDVPVGVFPQVPPNGFNDIVIGIMPGEPSPWQPTYQPMAVRYNCIKAYRRKTTFYYNKQLYVFYSTPAVISTFDYLDGGKISWTESSNTGSPAVHETPATGGLCDGFNYGYTWELSTDNANWSVIGTGENFPTLLQLPATCFIRRKVDCNGETQYSNTLYMEPLKPGAIYGGGNIPFNTLPSVMQDAASGGVCGVNDYVYTWERSFNNGAWVQFGTGINYPANAIIIGSCKVRRKVHCMFEDAYSNELPFIMLPYTSPNAENLNYVRTNDIVIPGIQSWEQADMLPTGDKLQSTTYLDGFGRPIQSVTKQGSFIPSAVGQGAENNISNYQDLVAYTQYDGLGRADKGFLPYATTTNLGFFKTNAAAEQQSFNNQKYGEPANSVYTYSQNTYDGSPLNRVTNVKLPGAALNSDVNYQGISSDYDFNKQTENVRVWDIGFNAGDVPVNNGIYPDSKLLKSITTDEKGKRIITYTDLGGHVILKRVQETDNAIYPPTGDDIGWLSTYYVYDDFGRLRYTITPKAVRSLMVQSTSNWVFYDALKKGLCFYQEYDNRGRVTVKHSPDGGEVWLVYDNRDRLVLSQDENQRNRAGLNPAKANQWSFSLYDENDRVLTTGLMNDSRNRNDMQAFVDGLAPQNQQVQIYTGTYETITAYNPVIINANAADVFINSASYYDDYSKAPANQTPVNLSASDFAPTTNKYVEQPAVSMIRMRGAATVSKVRKLTANYDNESSNATQFLTSTTYYDAKGRVVQSYSDNVKGGVDASAVLYDFAGKVLCTRGKHNMPNNDFDNLLVITKNDYDLLGRATRLWKLYTKNSADISNPAKYKKLSEIKLDELGRGKTKTIGDDPQNPGTALETMDFSYNMQGKLTGVNKDYALANAAGSMNNQWARRFGFYLGYENADNNFANKQYNGSITGVTWRSQGDNTQRKYDYEYDNINRFKAANFTQKDGGTSGAWGTALVDLSASVSGYDANGNIMGMVQKGIVPGTNGGVILDNLNYVYFPNSNRLRNVSDGASVAVSGKQGDFKDYATVTDYGYDANGNLTYDKNKNIIDVASNITDNSPKAGINSNFLDLPQTITIKDKSKTEYTYDASGNKLAKTVTQLTPNAPAPVTTWYIGGFVYEETGAKTTLQYILNEEGKLRITDVTPVTTPAGVIQVGITANVDFGLGAKWGVWDYYLKDNLGNTRMVLTEEGQMQVMKCTMEVSPPALKAEEEANFGNANKNEVDLTRTLDIVPGWNSNKTRASKLQPAVGAGTAIGPNVILKVMAGDIINARADYYYQAATPQQQNTNLLDNIVQSLLGSISGSTSVNSGVKAGIDLSYLQGSNTPIQPFLKDYHPATTGNQPRAYLNYIFFDEQFRYVPDCSGAKMVVAAGDGQPQLVPPIPKATHNGYVYVYLSNETPNIPVYFDNFQVSQIRGPIVEDNAYYPFGLKIQGISAKAAGKIKAKEGYQGNYNEQDEETGYNEFDLRFYDPQIGRWIQVDPYGEFASGYVGMGDDPVNNVDQDGGGVGDPVPTTLPEYVVVSTIKRASTVLQPSLVPHVVTLAINTYLSYTAINNNGTTTSTFLIPATNNPAQSINFNGQTYVASGSYNEEITKTEWVVKPEDPVVSVQRHLDEISKQCPSCIWREAIPYEKQVIAATDMFGDGHIGPREDVESNIQGVRANYINMLGDNIRNGPAAAAGQMLFGDKGNIIGSGVDGVITSLGGVRGGDQSTRFFGQQEQNIPVASRALFSGKNTEQMALADGYQTLGQTRAALNLQNLIESRGLSWREAEPMWGRLSRAWVNGIPNGSKIPVYLNNVRPNSVFQTYELTPARSKNLSLINKLKF